MSLTVYLNGSYLDENDAKISVFDSGFLYGDGVFESLRVYHKQCKFLDQHYHRLLNSAKIMNYLISFSEEELKSVIDELISRNNLDDAYIRITLTRGQSKIGFGKSISDNQTIFIIAKEHKPLDENLYKNGVKLAVADTRRNAPEAVNPQIKSISNLNSLLGKLEIKKKEVFEVVMLNSKDIVTECAAANIFWVKDQNVFTPDVTTGLLEGVTRSSIIEICEENGIELKTGHFTMAHILAADEVFISSTSLEVMPVKQIDKQKISDGNVGPMTKEIHQKFRERLI